jgi:hypothetical protein
MASPSSGRGEFYEFVFAHGLSVHQIWSSYALTNLLFGLCTFMWVFDFLVNLPSPYPEAPTRPSTLEMLRIKECAPIFFPSIVVTFGLVVESIKELGGVSCCSIVGRFNVKDNNYEQ